MRIVDWLRATVEGLEARVIEQERQKAAHDRWVLKGFRERQRAYLAVVQAENPHLHHLAKAACAQEYAGMVATMRHIQSTRREQEA